ncbi:MAG: hypothetical protein Q8M51_08300 [Polaromonas sp.]|uniref:hypothetical protein n=1 Tax=Polaromonas sp. TaxID=1869339 RepID=UPI00272FEEBC|nr:hypothetical protein [Polaromonas sp.]MDP1739480.1 hypothetical protein [Polaromonas sp.]MDP1953026.1 hypothetical protein [Polaromonas sp.]MDP3355848.1 hypothetical protein [Polaromonas sp.]MDP3751495.1 hypothetical protein [Polaromonas sp.]
MNQAILRCAGFFSAQLDQRFVQWFVNVKNVSVETKGGGILACSEHQLHGQIKRLPEHGRAKIGTKGRAKRSRRKRQQQAACQEAPIFDQLQKFSHLMDSGIADKQGRGTLPTATPRHHFFQQDTASIDCRK